MVSSLASEAMLVIMTGYERRAMPVVQNEAKCSDLAAILRTFTRLLRPELDQLLPRAAVEEGQRGRGLRGQALEVEHRPGDPPLRRVGRTEALGQRVEGALGGDPV